MLIAFSSVPATAQGSISMNFAADILPALFNLFHLKSIHTVNVAEVVVACPMRKSENNDGISPQKTRRNGLKEVKMFLAQKENQIHTVVVN